MPLPLQHKPILPFQPLLFMLLVLLLILLLLLLFNVLLLQFIMLLLPLMLRLHGEHSNPTVTTPGSGHGGEGDV
jgi:hypothetical protein